MALETPSEPGLFDDVAVLASPAGVTAATWLGRFGFALDQAPELGRSLFQFHLRIIVS